MLLYSDIDLTYSELFYIKLETRKTSSTLGHNPLREELCPAVECL